MNSKIELGRKGEDLALEFLLSKGLKLVCRNYRFRGGEIDLVMHDAAILVFIEVRSKIALEHGSALETINYKKRRQIEKTARYFLAREKVDPEVICRFDVVGVSIADNAAPVIDYVPNAFFSGE